MVVLIAVVSPSPLLISQVGSALEQGQGSESDYDVCLQVLVEVHSCCSSRHPLQRAISR